MSELINNKQKRKEILKDLIMQLHDGEEFEVVKNKFQEQFDGVTAKEISDIEQALIKDGMPIENIQKLCDVHAAVFEGSIEEIHRPDEEEKVPGHPVHTFLLENTHIENIVEKANKLVVNDDYNGILVELKKLLEIDKHYSRKENIIFPLLEKHDITGPPQVMWAIDDEVRNELKSIIVKLNNTSKLNNMKEEISNTLNKISEMVFKENNILIPMLLDTFSLEEWVEILDSSDEIGFSFVNIKSKWVPKNIVKKKIENSNLVNHVKFDAGALTQEEVNTMLNTLPLDITFVDSNDKVKYFSEGKERIFPRPRTIIGREIKNCHPPASVHIVEKLVADLKSGKKDNEDFWIKMGDNFVYIRYFAVRNEKNEYLGTLEVTQNIKNIVQLEGEKRLMSD